MKSFCTEFNRQTTLVRIDSPDKLAKKLRKRFLGNMFALKGFKQVDRMFLEMAFEQGAQVVFNRITANAI